MGSALTLKASESEIVGGAVRGRVGSSLGMRVPAFSPRSFVLGCGGLLRLEGCVITELLGLRLGLFQQENYGVRFFFQNSHISMHMNFSSRRKHLEAVNNPCVNTASEEPSSCSLWLPSALILVCFSFTFLPACLAADQQGEPEA